MTRITVLLKSRAAIIQRFDHPQGEPHVDGLPEQTKAYAVTYVVSGEFRIDRQNGSWSLSVGDALVSCPGTLQAIYHPPPGARDVCVSVRFHSTVIEDIFGSAPANPKTAKRPASTLNSFNLWRLTQAINEQDSALIEGIALSSAQCFLPGSNLDTLRWNAVDRNFGWYRLRVLRVCDYLEEHYAENCSLLNLAKMAHISAFHFARVFHYFVGMPIHQYIVKRRLLEAARSIRDGLTITDAAYGAGFSSLSYFSRAFRRHFGKPPTAFCASIHGYVSLQR